MNNVIEKFDALVLDTLKEIGNIGAGNAATALSRLTRQKVDMKVPKVNIINFSDVPSLLGGEENEVVGIFFRFSGEIEGTIMFLLELDSAQKLVSKLIPAAANDGFNELCLSAFSEIGNILTGTYVTALSQLSNLEIILSVPSLAIDMAGAILSVPVIQYGLYDDKLLLIENEFTEDIADSSSVNGFFILIPEVSSYKILFKNLGVPYDYTD